MTYLAFFLIAIAFSVLINGLLLKFSGTLGAKNSSDSSVVRWASTAKPALGGISFFIVFLISFATYAFISEAKLSSEYLGLFMASSVGFLIGLADDAYNTKPFLKFLGQFACAIIFIISGLYIQVFDNQWVNYTLTFVWVVGMMNSINMLDNMDGITTSVSLGAISLVMFSLILLDGMDHLFFWISLGIGASLLGFLYYNWNPSRMYMGDTGSQFLGALLSGLGIYFFWNGYGFNDASTLPKLITPIMAFLPSIVDTTTVTINRIFRGQSPFVGGKDHTTHHLSYFGLTDRQVAIVFLGLAFISCALSIWVNFYLTQWNSVTIAITTGYCLIVFVSLFTLTKYQKQK